MVEVRNVAEMGAYVSLLEYNNIEGMILLSELSRRRFRSINKLIRVGKTEVAMVIRVDKTKGYIDLSKRRVSREDIIKCEERYSKAKAVNSIMRHVAELTQDNLLDLNTKITWPLNKPPYKNAHEAFRISISEPERVFGPLDVDQGILDKLMTIIQRKLTPQPLRIRADIEVICYHTEGIDAVKAALFAGEKAGTEDMPIKLKLIASPKYVLLATSTDKKRGFEVVNNAIEKIREVITGFKGNLKVSEKPHVTSYEEEHQLKQELENKDEEDEDSDDSQ